MRECLDNPMHTQPVTEPPNYEAEEVADLEDAERDLQWLQDEALLRDEEFTNHDLERPGYLQHRGRRRAFFG